MPYKKRGGYYWRHGRRYSLKQVQAIYAQKARDKAANARKRRRKRG